MPGQPCAKHPTEITYVRCGRCDLPICVRCMVDTPVGKKCRSCADNRNRITESTGRQTAQAFAAAMVVALLTGWLVQTIRFLPILAFPYGYLIAEVTLRAGSRRRSVAMQAAAGAAACIGAFVGAGVVVGMDGSLVFVPAAGLQPYSLVVAAISAAVAVSRVRFI